MAQSRECPACALDAPVEVKTCPYCDYEFPAPKSGSLTVTWLMIGLMILLAVPFLRWLFG